jgi:hypothetical protein
MGQKTSFSSQLTDVYAFNNTLPLNGAREPVGAIRMEVNNVFKYVQFSGTTAIAAGNTLCYVVATADGNEVIVDTANTGMGAGIAMAAAAAGTLPGGTAPGGFMWIQIDGLASVTPAPTGSPAFGGALTTSGASNGGLAAQATEGSSAVAMFYSAGPPAKVVANFPY